MGKITIFDGRNDVEENIKKIGVDLYLVKFIADWYGWDRQGLPIGSVSESYKRKIKRNLQATNAFDERKWKDLRKGFRDLKNTNLLSTLFRREPLPPNPRNKPEDIAKWKTVHVLMYYFKKLSGKPHTNLIAEFFCIEGDSLVRQLSRWKGKVLLSDQAMICYENGKVKGITPIPFSPEDEFKRLEGFYLANKERIIEVFEKGVTLYELYNIIPDPPGVSEWTT